MPNTNPIIHLPDGNAIRRSNVVALSSKEMLFFRDFHAIAQRLNIGIHCAECGHDLQGANTGHESHFTISCSCREFKGERPQHDERTTTRRG